MEEIVDTGSLEREIFEDARKKAAKILKAADEEEERIRAQFAEKARSALAELTSAGEKKISRSRAETQARLPLERMRIRADFVDIRIRKALDDWLSGLPEARIEGFMLGMIRPSMEFFSGGGVELSFRGLSEQCAARMAAVFGGAGSVSAVKDDSLPAKGMVVRNDSAVLFATLDVAAEAILRKKRGELARALCSEALSS